MGHKKMRKADLFVECNQRDSKVVRIPMKIILQCLINRVKHFEQICYENILENLAQNL